jgi:hypothetical protein
LNGIANVPKHFTIKEKLTSTPILGYPANTDNWILDTDAIDVAIGAVLSQVDDGRETVISYGNKCCQRQRDTTA